MNLVNTHRNVYNPILGYTKYAPMGPHFMGTSSKKERVRLVLRVKDLINILIRKICTVCFLCDPTNFEHMAREKYPTCSLLSYSELTLSIGMTLRWK